MGKCYDKKYTLEVILLGTKLYDNVRALQKEHPAEVDAIVAEALLMAADYASEKTWDMHCFIIMANALKNVAMNYPGLLHREDLCQTIEDIIYQHTPEEGESEEQ